MLLVERGTAMSNVEVAHLAFDAAGIEASATADAASSSDFGEERVAPGR
jgi:hypothetical protein